MFGIQKLPEISFFCQEVNIPDFGLPSAETSTPLVNIRFPGDKPVYGDLQLQFLVDENMDNYIAVHDWIVGMGFPESWDQYAKFVSTRTDALNNNNAAAAVSDGILQILGSSNTPVRTIRFVDMFPVSLGSVQLQSTSQDTTYIAGQVTFAYSYYKFE